MSLVSCPYFGRSVLGCIEAEPNFATKGSCCRVFKIYKIGTLLHRAKHLCCWGGRVVVVVVVVVVAVVVVVIVVF